MTEFSKWLSSLSYGWILGGLALLLIGFYFLFNAFPRTRPVKGQLLCLVGIDLITLLFFIYAHTVEPDWPAERYLRYIDGINEILARCHMQGIYPANPYEAFVLMCIVTECPLDVYAEVWEMSFKD